MLTLAYPRSSPTTTTTTTTDAVAHALQSSKHRPPNKASYLVSHPPRKRIKSILADNLPSPPPFERASKNLSLYTHPGSSTEALTSSSSYKAKLPSSSKLKRKSIPQRPPSPNHTDYSSPDLSSKLLFTPAKVYPIASSRSTTSFLVQKSVSSPLLSDHLQASPPPYSKHPTPVPVPDQSSPHMNVVSSDTEDDRDDSDMIYTSRTGSTARPASSSSQSLRSRIFGLASTNASRVRDKPICTGPGMLCAGETETETDEPSRHLPTARIIPSSGPLIPPNTLEQRLTPLLFEFSRLLSIVPAIFGTLYNLYHIFHPPTYDRTSNNGRPPPERVDYFISALWAILTGYQCLSLATGLLTRWRVYYPPLSTLVRLLALQGICWPATHLTLTILEHEKRPVICWAIIATTTCMSRSVQIWVTSNLWWDSSHSSHHHHPHHHHHHHHPPPPPHSGSGVTNNNNGNGITVNGGGGGIAIISPSGSGTGTGVGVSPVPTPMPMPLRKESNRHPYWRRWGGGGKWGGRRWDWKEVGIKCVLPAGIVYFIMAWAEVLRREFALA